MLRPGLSPAGQPGHGRQHATQHATPGTIGSQALGHIVLLNLKDQIYPGASGPYVAGGYVPAGMHGLGAPPQYMEGLVSYLRENGNLAAINIARGRDTGVPSLNVARGSRCST